MDAFIFFLLFSSFIFSNVLGLETNSPTLSCSHGGAPTIQFPFQIEGHGTFKLLCKDNTTIIHFPDYGDLIVKSISYNPRKLDLLDPKNCVHQVFLNLNLSLTPFQYYYVVKKYTYLSCSARLPPSFSEIPCLSGSENHVYTVESSLPVPASCRVVKTVEIPLPYSPYLSDNSFGLGLTWDLPGCEDSESKGCHRVFSCGTEQETRCFYIPHEKDSSCGLLSEICCCDVGQGGDTSRSYYQGQRPELKLTVEKKGNNDPRSQSHDEDMDVGNEDNSLLHTFKGLEGKFLDDITKLAKGQNDAEDAENARHREKINAINSQYQEQLAALRALHASHRDEFLRRESSARQHQYQQSIRDHFPNSGIGPSDPRGYSGVADPAAGGEAHRAYNTDHFESFREQARFLGGARDRGFEHRGEYPGGRVYDTDSRPRYY